MDEDMALTDVARALAGLVDAALADDWNEDEPTMALLWQASSDPDDLRLAIRRLERPVEDELAPVADAGSYLAVAHSTVTRRPPAGLVGHSGGLPVRLTVAVDSEVESGVLRHRNGATEWFGTVDLPIVGLVRSLLWLEPAY